MYTPRAIIIVSILVIAISFEKTDANVGDIIWHQCGNVSVSIISLKNACVSLVEAQNCSVNITASVEGQQVFVQGFDGVAPQVCAPYTISGTTCNICGRIKEDPNNSSQQCLVGTGTCGWITLPSRTVGCFPKSSLSSILTCREHLCPNQCSGKGSCKDGKCKCNSGWYGDDCSSTVPSFQQCVAISEITGPACVKVALQNCQMVLGLYLNNYQLWNESFPVAALKSVLSTEYCQDAPAVSCTSCLLWRNLNLNSTSASGCGSMTLTCYGIEYGTYDIGCFENDNIVPQCFSSCKNNCTNHGACQNGICACYGDWGGDDCSHLKPDDACNPPCSEHGTCMNGVCKCSSQDYGGSDCGNYIGSAPSNSQVNKPPSTAVLVIVPLFVIIALGLAAYGVWWFLKRRQQPPQTTFHHLDLIEENEEPIQLEEEETQEVGTNGTIQ